MWKPLLVTLCLAAPAFGDVTFTGSLPVHGNYCGPGWGQGLPVDALDAACMRHDFCVSRQGYGSCGCDIGFMQELATMAYPNTAMEEEARAISEVIAIVPCDDPAGQQLKADMALGDWAARVASGAEPPWAVLDRLRRLAETAFGG